MTELFPYNQVTAPPPELLMQRNRVATLQRELEEVIAKAGDNYNPAVFEKRGELEGAQGRLAWLEAMELNKAKQ